MKPVRREAGATMVEFALVIPVLACLLLGMITGGYAYHRKISMTSAVREGARYGATLQAGSFSATDLTTWETAVKQRVVQTSGGEVVLANICAKLVTVPDATNQCGVTDPAGTTAGNHVVKVRAQGTAKLEAFFFSRTLTLEAKTAARYEREAS